jgi:2-C-methyl-D-erythritol 4-phosphate cytidylyltransferase
MAANDPMIVAAIVVAAGSGTRLGAGLPKAFVQVGGRTLLEHAVERISAHPRVDTVVVAVPAEQVTRAAALVGSATVVAGGSTRQQSVAAALAAVPRGVAAVLVHDAARAFVPVEVVDRVVAALDDGATAVVPSVPVRDTIRTVDAAGKLGELVERSGLLAMQTPQGFRRDVLDRAHASARVQDATDDAALVEDLGEQVTAVSGDERAFKVTTPFDLAVAAAVLNG